MGLIILFIIFMTFLCCLHWKRRYDEEQERKDDKRFQADLRQHAQLMADAERNAKLEEQEEYEDADSNSDASDSKEDDEESVVGGDVAEEYDDDELDGKPTRSGGTSPNNLAAPGGGSNTYDRVVSYSKNEMPGKDGMGGNGKDGYQDPDKQKKKKKKKKRKKKKKVEDDDDEYEEY